MGVISNANLKTWLGISDSADDARITFAVNGANSGVVAFCGRAFDKTTVGQETTRVYVANDACRVLVHDFWDTTNLLVKTDDNNDGTAETTWVTVTDYQLEPLNHLDGDIYSPYYRLIAVGNRRFPTSGRRPRVSVTAAWGWAAVPDDVVEATLIKAARLYKRKDSPEGIVGGWVETPVRVTQREDPDACALLRPYVRAGTRPLVG